MSSIKNERLTYFALIALSVCIYMAKPWEATLQAMDSAIHARYALEVTRASSLLPQLPIRSFLVNSSLPYFNDQPFLPFYLVGKFMRLFGANAWGARFLPSLAGVLNVALVIAIVRKLSGYSASIFAAVCMLASPVLIQFTARFQLDPFLVFFILLSFKAVTDGHFWRVGIHSGLAVCFKSPVGWLVLPALFCSEYFSKNFLKALFPALALPASMWLSANWISHEPLLQDYVSRQVLGTAVGGRGYSDHADWMTGYRVFKSNLIVPFAFLLAGVLLSRFKIFRDVRRNQQTHVFIIGFAIFWFIISMMRFKFPHYFMPGIPLFIIAVASSLRAENLSWFEKLEKPIWSISGVAVFGLLALPIPTVPESFPALRHFAAVIQSQGTEADRILFVNHAQPYGGDGDYFVESVFYTERMFMSSPCEQAPANIQAIDPTWIITSGDEAYACLPATAKVRYPTAWRFGNQYLLTRLPQSVSGVIDLTFEDRILKAPIDGKASELTRDVFHRY